MQVKETHNGQVYGRSLITDNTIEIFRKHLSKREMMDVLRAYAETIIKLLEIAPYVVDLPHISYVRIIENFVSRERLQAIKIDLVTNGFDFGTVNPGMLKKVKQLEIEVRRLVSK